MSGSEMKEKKRSKFLEDGKVHQHVTFRIHPPLTIQSSLIGQNREVNHFKLS